MKLNILDTHSRLKHLIEDQSANIFQGADDCMKKNPLSLALQEKSPYIYIFAHPRTHDDGVNKRMLWQPRLSIPPVQTNSYLFRAISHSDIIETIWIIPEETMWNQYDKGKVTESNWAYWSIKQFKTNKNELEKPHPEDLPEDRQKAIMRSILEEHEQKIKSDKLYKTLMDNLYL